MTRATVVTTCNKPKTVPVFLYINQRYYYIFCSIDLSEATIYTIDKHSCVLASIFGHSDTLVASLYPDHFKPLV